MVGGWHSGIGDGLFEQFLAVAVVVNGEVLVQPDHRGVMAQQTRTETVKRAGPRKMFLDQIVQPLLHFVSGLVGERHGYDLVRRHAVSNHVGNAMDQNASFAAARSGQNQQWTFDMLDRPPLARVERFE